MVPPPVTLQVTAVLELPLTWAVNCCGCPTLRVTAGGETVTTTTGCTVTVAAALLGVAFLHHMYKLQRDTGDRWARKSFGFSISYLFVLFSVMILDHFVHLL